MSLELIGKYIGSDEIVSINLVDFKTPKGSEIYEVTFKTGRSHIFSEKALGLIVTDELSDATTVQDKKFKPMVDEIVEIISEYDVNLGEIEMMFKQIAGKFDLEFNKAMSFLWFKNSKEFVEGFSPTHFASLLMAKGINKDIPNEKQDNG